jgi:DNA-binding SARP family transcriptional activator
MPGMRDDPGVPPAPVPTLTLHLHADTRAVAADGQVLPLRGRAAGLVALVALEPGGIGRERAALLLWPDSPNPRQALRQQLLRFRQSLAQPLIEGDELMHLAAGVAQAPALPGAPLLADEPVGGDAFNQWLQQQRQAQALSQREPLLQALAAAEAAGELDAALARAQALVALEPDDEAHHTALMRVHYLRGEPAAGLAVHEQLAKRLQQRYGTHPAAATAALAAALRRESLAGGAAAMGTAGDANAVTRPGIGPGALPVTLRRPPLLAGRTAERAALEQAWAEGRVALVLGEAGMGKSRLLADMLAGQRNALQAAGRPGDAAVPYGTLVRLLQPLWEPLPDSLDAASRATLARIARRAESAAAATGHPSAEPHPEALRPGALQSAVAALLAHAGVATVALDDLHFADPATLELIAALASHDTGRRWVLAQRPSEGPAALQALLDGLAEEHRLSAVRLSPLDVSAAVELLNALAIGGLHSATLAPALVRHSGGNPLFLLETLKQGLVDGSLARGTLPRPASVGALIERRLQRLSEPALNLARVAAIAGVDFRIELAESALGQSAVQLASAWQELQQAQVLRDEAFAHDLVADAVLAGLPQVVARRVHALCAAWLQAQGGEPARVAWHWRTGGLPLQAAEAFGQAALRAGAAARQAEEAELQGQAAAAYAEAGRPAERFEALCARVNALIGARADDAALAEARALAGAAVDDAGRARAARVLADLLGQRGPFDEAIAVGRAGIVLALAAGAQEELVRLSALTAGNLCKVGAADESYSMLLPLREWVDACGDDSLRLIWYGYWAATLGHIGRLREGVAAYDTAAAAAERQGNRPGHSMALLNQSVVLRTMGALERACAGSRRGLVLAPDESGNANHRLARLMHARNEAETGHFGAALQTLDVLLPEFDAMGAPFWVWAARGTQARLWQHLGQHARAVQALQGPSTDGLPAWMQAGIVWIGLEVAQWREQRVDEPALQQALALLDADAHRRVGNRVRGLRFEPAKAVLAAVAPLAAAAQKNELFGVLAALRLHEARAAVALADARRAGAAARALQSLLDEAYAPDFTYAPEAHLVASDAFALAGDAAAARRAHDAGVAWIQTRALPQVPAPFIESFLQRNPVNRRLLGGRSASSL